MIKLMEGDCLERMGEIPDDSVDLVLTDPPYGTTRCKWDSVIPLGLMWEQVKRVTKPKGAIVLFSAEPFTSALVMSNPKMFRYDLIWSKSQGSDFLNANRKPLRSHENVLVFSTGQTKYNPQMRPGDPYVSHRNGSKNTECYGKFKTVETVSDGSRFPLTVMDYPKDRGLHPSQKPVPLLEYLIKTYTDEGETVLDFTMGSGSTGVACVNTGRSFIGIELDEHYFDVATERILGDGVVE